MTASVHATETLLLSVLLQLTVMIAAARLLGAAARAIGQPGVVGEIVAGLLLGPSLFGHFFPTVSATLFGGALAPITVISQIGLVLLMFQIGTEFEFGQLRARHLRTATGWIALVSVAVPSSLGFGFGQVSAAALAPGIDPLAYSLFCGVAMAITAVPILGRILREFGLTHDPVGVVAISAAAINDVVGWVLLACISAYVTTQLSAGFVLWRLAALVAGGPILWFVLRPLVDRALRALPVQRGQLAPDLIAGVMCLVFVLGIATNAIGIFTIFGGFAGGLLFHRHRAFVEAWREQVGQFVLVFFLPVFFTFTGLRTNLLGLSAAGLGWLGLVLALSICGKVIPVYYASRACGFDRWQSAVLGSLMNTRALMELIVLNIGLDLGFLPQPVFTMLVLMAIATTVMTGPLLHILLPRMGHRMAERAQA